MKFRPSHLAFGLITAFMTHAAIAAGPVATVNGKAIPESFEKMLLDEQLAQGIPDSPQLRDNIREELIRREILSQEAAKLKLDRAPEVRTQMEMTRQTILIRAYVMDYVKKNPVSDAEIKKEYDGLKTRLGGNEYKPRHILVETEDEAKAIITKLNSKGKFADLAKQSLDPGSKERGGELGWSNPAMYVQPFSDAMVKLKKGEYTKVPVKTDFGYHVILLEDVRPLQMPSLDEVKPQIVQRLEGLKVQQLMEDLRSKAKVS